jgi:hypothetical protein
MISAPKRDQPSPRSLLTGTARPVTNSVEAREYFKGHPEPTAAPDKERRTFRKKRREDEAETPPTEPTTDEPEGEEEVEDEE